MNTHRMLTQMCQDVLSDTDIKAICKSRGFSANEAASRTVFESYFLSNIGVKTALDSLNREEIILLHLLRWEGKTVNIAFFERLYGTGADRYGTYTRRYTPVFKAVQSRLVRQGLLLVAPGETGETKMERWRFRFPQAFEPFLPPILQNKVRFPVEGEVNQGFLRRKLLEIVNKRSETSIAKQERLILNRGRLYLGERPFSVDGLFQWQRSHWHEAVWSSENEKRGDPATKLKMLTTRDLTAIRIEKMDFTPIVSYAFSQLHPDECVKPAELSPLLRLFYAGIEPPSGETVCKAGWESGCLARHRTEDGDYYRLPKTQEPAEEDPGSYLKFTADSLLSVDLHGIPYASLEHIAAISDLQVRGSDLVASPNLIRLGEASEKRWNHPLNRWLKDHSTAFHHAMEAIAARRGKIIVHDNLLLARVRDLSLKVQIQKAFLDSPDLVMLENDFIAFPRELLKDIEKLVSKSGYVVKTIQASS